MHQYCLESVPKFYSSDTQGRLIQGVLSHQDIYLLFSIMSACGLYRTKIKFIYSGRINVIEYLRQKKPVLYSLSFSDKKHVSISFEFSDKKNIFEHYLSFSDKKTFLSFSDKKTYSSISVKKIFEFLEKHTE
jgi:hypothetical protein